MRFWWARLWSPAPTRLLRLMSFWARLRVSVKSMVRVKICGITNLDDALAAVEYGADALGFVFAPSPRQVTPEKVRRITKKLPPFVCKVGIFVNSELEFVKQTMAVCNLDLAQLHGNEGTEYCTALSPRAI